METDEQRRERRAAAGPGRDTRITSAAFSELMDEMADCTFDLYELDEVIAAEEEAKKKAPPKSDPRRIRS